MKRFLVEDQVNLSLHFPSAFWYAHFCFVSTAQFVSLPVINESSPGNSYTFFLYTFLTTFVTSV